MAYHFFDYKYNIPEFTSDLFCPAHLLYIGAVLILSFFITYQLRSTPHDTVRRVLKIQAVFTVLLEVCKITWESYYDITTGRGFNWEGLLPIYTCSLLIYTLPFAAREKGFARDCACKFLTTIGLLYGAVGVIYCNGLNYYPFWTFGAFYSLYFHASMYFTGLFLLMTGYQKLTWRDALEAAVPVLLLSAAAIPVNYILGSDYMMIYSGSGLPLYEALAAYLAARHLRFLYTVIMMLTHIPLAILVIGAYRLAGHVFVRRRRSVRRAA
ncbi:MAG: YwaF family protein [Lachnospiraceae bacterium]|nr:YwaF family protein [Lachnospiraceae bacterium]